MALELKSTGGKLRRLQAWKLYRIRETGNLAFVANPENWNEVREILTKINKGEELNGNDSTYSDSEIRRYLKL